MFLKALRKSLLHFSSRRKGITKVKTLFEKKSRLLLNDFLK
jgi:hypothetical protein